MADEQLCAELSAVTLRHLARRHTDATLNSIWDRLRDPSCGPLQFIVYDTATTQVLGDVTAEVECVDWNRKEFLMRPWDDVMLSQPETKTIAAFTKSKPVTIQLVVDPLQPTRAPRTVASAGRFWLEVDWTPFARFENKEYSPGVALFALTDSDEDPYDYLLSVRLKRTKPAADKAVQAVADQSAPVS